MDLRMFAWAGRYATAVVVFSTACGSATTTPGAGGSGGRAQGGAGGKASQSGQPTSTNVERSSGSSGSSSSRSGTSGGPSADGGSPPDAAAPDASMVTDPRRVLVTDEGNRRVVLLDLNNPSHAIWSRQLNDPIKDGDSIRDLQLVGGDRVAVSVAKGYVELDIKTGDIKKEVSTFDGVESLRRLPSGNTILAGNSDGGVTLQELDSQDAPVAGHKVTFTNYGWFRLLRRTPKGTFLIGVGNKVAEVNWDKQTLWEMDFPPAANHDVNYMYQALRLPDNTIAVTAGYAAAVLIVDPTTKKVRTTLGGPGQPDATTIVPNFYAGFQILPNGHFVVTNWEGHGGANGGTGIQLLEYSASGALVWKWKQDPNLVSSLHNVIVLDGLDTTKLHDDVNGVLAPVTQ